ncbi:ABC transporter ATP-binding protein [Wohlfahrtiimonas chitiniclastica]|uniref:ABC transporter ATP-binding protein n=1 Tax=Wohlfahrtiimonas chitiniclastica TaxID=400946 RepID=UPI001BCC4748|nr:ABC transporter ATP-binding protein [Wohlfahrtiimonas chitiniclastica]MBS7817701.1 ABC transporter ATP-binding protein [Wohlfahrtiimonas chitiniclastica]
MKHQNIYQPISTWLRRSMMMATIAQTMKMGLWLMMLAIVWALSEQKFNHAYGLTFALLLFSIAYYTLKIKAHDQAHYGAFELEEILRQRLAKKISELPIGYVRQIGTGGVSKILLDDVHALHTYVADAPPLKAEAYATPILIFIVLLIFNWPFALAIFVFCAAIFLALQVLMKRGRYFRKQYVMALAQVNTAIIEYVQGMSTVRAFDAGDSSFGRYQASLEDYNNVMQAWLGKIGLGNRLARTLFSPMPMQIFLLIVGTVSYLHDAISFIDLILFFMLAAGIVESLHPYMGLHSLLEKSRASIERIWEIEAMTGLSEPTEEDAQSPQLHHLCYENVSFTYDENGQRVLTDVSFQVPEHSFTAIIGSSGSGKTTLINLLHRFWDVTEGAIKIGDVDIRMMTQADLMSRCSFVFQDSFLFSCSIIDNIRYGIEATDEQVIEAAKLANIHEFIMTLPEQYETKVGERGQLLSGGQKQRLTIARAFLQNRPILVLDEPTAFSDAKNEALLMQAFQKLMVNKTVIMIAHRLSTIIEADQIIYLDQGRIIAKGSHQQLLLNNDAYRKLWRDYQETQNWTMMQN